MLVVLFELGEIVARSAMVWFLHYPRAVTRVALGPSSGGKGTFAKFEGSSWEIA